MQQREINAPGVVKAHLPPDTRSVLRYLPKLHNLVSIKKKNLSKYMYGDGIHDSPPPEAK